MWHRAVEVIWGVLALQGAQLPAPRGFVNDFAEVIPAESERRIERIARAVQATTGGDIAVITLPDLEGRPVEEVALRFLREWELGRAGGPTDPTRNTGVAILIVPKETSTSGRGEVRIEVGYGAEGFLTDAMAGDLIREAVPLFQRQAYGEAAELLAAGVARRFEGEFGVSLDTAIGAAGPRAPPRPVPSVGIPAPLVIIGLIFFFLLLSSMGGRRRRRGCGGCIPIFLPFPIGGPGYRGGWHGGGWGGGFGGGGFGGGGFGGFGGGGGGGGGGASGSW